MPLAIALEVRLLLNHSLVGVEVAFRVESADHLTLVDAVVRSERDHDDEGRNISSAQSKKECEVVSILKCCFRIFHSRCVV